MANEDGASSNYPPRRGVRPSNPPPTIGQGDISDKIFELQLELAERTRELGGRSG